MAENRCSCGGQGNAASASVGRETVCIDTYRVLDSCRDRDCYEDVRVFLTAFGQEIIDQTCTVRAKSASVIWTNVGVDSVPFNRGFYQVSVRIYILLTMEACLGNGRSQEFDGIAVLEKKVILFGSEGNVSIFRSTQSENFCDVQCSKETNLPVGVVEVVAPIALSTKILEGDCCCGYSCCNCSDIPSGICELCSGDLVDPENGRRLFVSLGVFSVIRIERPAQFLITASDYSVPDKECVAAEEDDPCSLFRTLAFPVNEFSPLPLSAFNAQRDEEDHDGCRRK
ncbi:MAG: hypothetical protein IJW71_02780 [Clostridia bacterium]|nr:hypothetical protein [Clostridia bacterium]